MLASVQTAIRKHRQFTPGQRVLVAVSGGADSVALLLALHELAPSLRLRLVVAHLNHAIRGRAADTDAAFVAALARRLHLPCICARVDVPELARREGLSLEMAARQARYAFFARVVARRRLDAVATAHTADDQAETVLLKLARGSGPRGLAGIARVSRLGTLTVVRPMLDVSRHDVVTFLRERHQAWREDRSNAGLAPLRNRVRHHILPLLEQDLNPNIRAVLVRTAKILREEDAWLGGIAAAYLRRLARRDGSLRVAGLRRLRLAARRRVLRLWLARRGVPADTIDFDTVDRVESLLCRRSGSRTALLAGGWQAEQVQDRLVASKPEAPAAFHRPMMIPGITELPEVGLRVIARLRPGIVKDRARFGVLPVRASLSAARAAGKPIVLRSWKPGDRMKPFGMAGTRKVQDIFVDAKVPSALRHRLPILECGGEIIWLPGYRIARGWEVPSPKALSLQVTLEPLGPVARRLNH